MSLSSDRYSIMNVEQGTVLALPVNAHTSGTPVECQSWQNGDNQTWTVLSSGISADLFRIICFDPQLSLSGNAKAKAAVAEDRITMQWKIIGEGRAHRIWWPAQDKYLECQSSNNGATVTLGNKTNKKNQLWLFRIPDGTSASDHPNLQEEAVYSVPSQLREQDIQSLSEQIKAKPNDTILYLARSAAFAKRMRWTDALQDAEKIIELDSTSILGFQQKSKVFCTFNRYDKATAAIDDRLSRGGLTYDDHTKLTNMKAQILEVQGTNDRQFQELVDIYTAAIQLNPQDDVLYAKRSEARAALNGNLEAAFADAEQSIKLNPKSGLGYYRKGDVLERLRYSVEADRVYAAMMSNKASGTDNKESTVPGGSGDVFFDITIADNPVGRITFKLYDTVVPKAARNFRELATGQNGFGYKNSTFFHAVRGQRCFGGRINGRKGRSIYNEAITETNSNIFWRPGMLYLDFEPIDSRFTISIDGPYDHGLFIGEVAGGLEVVSMICSKNPTFERIVISASGTC